MDRDLYGRPLWEKTEANGHERAPEEEDSCSDDEEEEDEVTHVVSRHVEQPRRPHCSLQAKRSG